MNAPSLSRLLLVAIVTILLPLQSVQAQAGRIEFARAEHDFGQITEGEVPTYTFSFRNTGDADLKLVSVRPSCGCTVPEYPRAAIAPGEGFNVLTGETGAGKSILIAALGLLLGNRATGDTAGAEKGIFPVHADQPSDRSRREAREVLRCAQRM